MLLAGRLALPDRIQAVLFDLDGVLVDTLNMEAGIVDGLLAQEVPGAPPIPRELFRSSFPLPVPESWAAILDGLGIGHDDDRIARLTAALDRVRLESTPEVLPGIPELLDDAREALLVAVVSNNPVAQVREMLRSVGLADDLLVVGNDQGLPSKPEPDMYLRAASELGVDAGACAVIEDSILGATAGRRAGCFVVGVATGPATFDDLASSDVVDRAYRRFGVPEVAFAEGDVVDKGLDTPNEFVSHMLEHIAWRAGCSVQLVWHSDDWRALGRQVGAALGAMLSASGESRAMGLIDDGSAEVTVRRPSPGALQLTAPAEKLAWFVDLRVEQLASGHPLVALLEGLADGAEIALDVVVGSVEDAHHTWEAVFRGIGLALRDLSPALQAHAQGFELRRVARPGAMGLTVEAASTTSARVRRATAESVCVAEIELEASSFATTIETSPSVDVRGLVELVDAFAAGVGLGGSVTFEATKLSSSHVVAEDVGMTLGAAFHALALQRMEATGIEGFGWSSQPVGTSEELKVAVSWEGRKFLKLLPVGWGEDDLKRFRVGTTLANGLFSEDLDDFLDGFVGGMHASVMIHWPETADLDAAWQAIFGGLGAALAMALHINRSRQGLIAGVKATLA